MSKTFRKRVKKQMKEACDMLLEADVRLRAAAALEESEAKGDMAIARDGDTVVVAPVTGEAEFKEEEFGSRKKAPKRNWSKAFGSPAS